CEVTHGYRPPFIACTRTHSHALTRSARTRCTRRRPVALARPARHRIALYLSAPATQAESLTHQVPDAIATAELAVGPDRGRRPGDFELDVGVPLVRHGGVEAGQRTGRTAEC